MQGNSTDSVDIPTTRRCYKCGEEKSRDQFQCANLCRDCNRRWHRENNKRPERKAQHLAGVLMHKFGLTLEQFESMVEEQGGVCAICKKVCTRRTRLSVDHDHATGKVRGLLCIMCNNLLGWVNDDIGLLLTAIEYLRRHSDDQVGIVVPVDMTP